MSLPRNSAGGHHPTPAGRGTSLKAYVLHEAAERRGGVG